ncbi:MAG: hypothetical protein CML04_03205 [Pseudozobellia sp.]|nr:hypothetical protein [Pseudozobellia sp.]MBG49151.1 hypothetical protein [Pseudozobellia sp.]|tara:strand:+ start:2640 stop:3581 length:942 start_codon:yes stop_codon:yes gene_type:complete
MNGLLKIAAYSMAIGLLMSPLYAQEPEEEFNEQKSAELFLENYSDEFQENFFEALKQKGIENYDKAINLLLKCKNIDPGKLVVDHELAKVYLKEKEYPLAEDYAFEALQNEPDNLWYADTFVEALRKQGKEFDNAKNQLPNHQKLNENLALAYFKKRDYETALSILKNADKSDFAAALAVKINDSLEKRKDEITSTSFSVSSENNAEVNTFNQYKVQIDNFLRTDNFIMLEKISSEALESFPSQPLLYYAQGRALNKKGKHREAIELLETGLDYLIGDISLGNKFYQELSDAYNSINNSVRANMYLRKIKPGF